MGESYIYQVIALVLLVAAALGFYIIPDARRKRALKAKVANLQPGSTVETKNGLRGRVEEVYADHVIISATPGGLRLEIATWGIADVLREASTSPNQKD